MKLNSNISLPSIKLSEDSVSLPKDITLEVIEDEQNESQFRMFKAFQNSIQSVANNCIGAPNTQETYDRLAQSLQEMAGVQWSKVEIAPLIEEDKVAEDCDSYEEYKLRKTVENGEDVDVAEDEFWVRHDPSSKFSRRVQITIELPKSIEYTQINMIVDRDNLNTYVKNGSKCSI